MKLVLPILALLVVMVFPVWAGGFEEFDPDQPFTEVVPKHLWQSWLHHALDALDEHLEIAGTLVPDEANGDRRSHLRLKIYPEGKSKSSDSITAEGWVHRSPDGRQQELFFRFTLPESSSKNDSAQFEYRL
jgi:hypothetical protein